MKKIIYKLVVKSCLAAGLLFMPLTVQAEENENPKDSNELIQMELFQEGKFPAPEVVLASEELSAETEKDFKEYLHKSFLRFDKQIPVEQYRLSKDNVRRLMQDLINDNPELFIVSGECSVTLAGDVVQSVEPVYVASSDDLTAYNVEMQRILGLVNSSWSDLEKLLFIHDYMASNYEYDLTYTRYSAQELLLEHKGVCQAYTLAYLAIISELGIPVERVRPSDMNHTWNVVQLNGNWYHIDVTWDDPISDTFGAARHTRFLLSDTAMMREHNNSETGTSRVCNDTKYDNYYWRDINAPFAWNNGKWYVLVYKGYEYNWENWNTYYISNICECIPSTGIGRSVFDIKTLFWNDENLGSFEDKLYYLSDYGINTYDLKKSKNSIEYPNPSSPYQYFVIDGLNLNYKLENGNTGKFVFKDNDIVVKTFNDFEYLISPYHKTVTLLNYTGNVKNVVIPDTIEGYKVQKIADSLFAEHEEIESISIPESVTFIGGSAFKECSHLKNITIPDNVTSIEDSLFEDCSSLESITIPDNVTSIGERAFYRCSSLTSVTIPDQVTHIGWGGFVNCSKLNSITIGKDVNYIDDYAFWGCKRLTSVYYRGDVPDVGDIIYNYTPDTLISYYSEGNATWKAAIEGGQWQDRGTAAWRPEPSSKSPVITVQPVSQTVNEGSSAPFTVTATGTAPLSYQWYKDGKAISGETSSSYTISSVKTSDAGSYTVTVSNSTGSVTSVVATLTVNKPVGNTFTFGNLTYTVMEENGNTGTVSVKASSTNISGVLSIPDTVRNNAVNYKIEEIDDHGFQYCSNLTSVTIPDNVSYIGWEAFADCTNLANIKLPDGNFVRISIYAFNRSGLQSLYIPKNTYWSACPYTGYVNDCDELRTVTVHPENPYLCSIDGVMYSKDKTTICLYPAKRSGTSYEILNTVETVLQSAFSGAKNLKEVIIPDSVTIIKGLAFAGCTGLKSVIVPDSVTELGHELNGSTFAGCTSLENVTLGRSLETIRMYAFYRCTNLKSITMGENVNYIDDYAFWGCVNLSSVYYRGDVPDVGDTIYIYTPDTLISYYPRGNASWKAAIQNGKWQGRGTAEWDAPVPPKVSYKRKNNTLTLTFTGTLQESTDCKKWTNVSGAQGTYTVNTGKNKKFYRSVQ